MTIALDPVWLPGTQREVYRNVLSAFDRPGVAMPMPASIGDTPAWLAALAALTDGTMTVADVDAVLLQDDWRFVEARPALSGEADLILADGRTLPPAGFQPRVGTYDCPEDGATLILTVERIGEGRLHLIMAGPGVEGEIATRVSGCERIWFDARARWCVRFPLGIEVLLADDRSVLALPRTTLAYCGG